MNYNTFTVLTSKKYSLQHKILLSCYPSSRWNWNNKQKIEKRKFNREIGFFTVFRQRTSKIATSWIEWFTHKSQLTTQVLQFPPKTGYSLKYFNRNLGTDYKMFQVAILDVLCLKTWQVLLLKFKFIFVQAHIYMYYTLNIYYKIEGLWNIWKYPWVDQKLLIGT
jgi:hypothetical protein